ncbi:hypothetical protein JMJ77_0011212, partial [Colletotrichum scovillei]
GLPGRCKTKPYSVAWWGPNNLRSTDPLAGRSAVQSMHRSIQHRTNRTGPVGCLRVPLSAPPPVHGACVVFSPAPFFGP